MRSFYIIFFSLLIGLSACQSQEAEIEPEPITETPESKNKSLSIFHPIFSPILAELKNNTKIPLALPTHIPEYTDPNSLYGIIEKINSSEYSILLAFTEDCTGGTACRLGSISGKKISSENDNLSGQEVALINNVTGYFTDAVCGANCSDSSLSWVEDGVYYAVTLKAGKQETLIKMANSAILPDRTLQSTSNAIKKQFLISSVGIGQAKLGMTIEELKQVLGQDTEFKIESSFMVDIVAISVTKNGEIQYYILYPGGTTISDSEPINYLMTKNSTYQTQEGIQVGTTIQKAENIYGEATLSFSTYNESREYIKFANQPSKNIRFRPNLNDLGFVGIYPSDLKEYNETQEFQSGSKIDSIEVFCPPQNC